MKRSTRLLDLGRVSKRTKGSPFYVYYETAMPPNNWWYFF